MFFLKNFFSFHAVKNFFCESPRPSGAWEPFFCPAGENFENRGLFAWDPMRARAHAWGARPCTPAGTHGAPHASPRACMGARALFRSDFPTASVLDAVVRRGRGADFPTASFLGVVAQIPLKGLHQINFWSPLSIRQNQFKSNISHNTCSRRAG